MDTCVVLKDDTFPQLLAIHRIADDAVARIHRAIVREQSGNARIEAVLQPDGAVGSTSVVDFDTTREVRETSPYKSHVNHVVLDSNYEAKVAQSLEAMDEVVRYVKNDHLGFVIPYTIDGHQRSYLPDYIVVIDDGRDGGPLNLVLEVSGRLRRDKAEKVATARNCWVPAVNASDLGLGRWEFLETRDPWNVKSEIRAYLRSDKRRA
jgi:type III restriction enzyme